MLCIFQAPACEKAWIFERVPGYELAGYDHRITANVVGRVDCQELCLKTEDLPCRSAEYVYKTRTCRMSKETRRTQPASYRYVSEMKLLPFRNFLLAMDLAFSGRKR